MSGPTRRPVPGTAVPAMITGLGAIAFPNRAGVPHTREFFGDRSTKNGVAAAPGHTFRGDSTNVRDAVDPGRRMSNRVVAGHVRGTDGRPIQQ